jgi:hypothetical protein
MIDVCFVDKSVEEKALVELGIIFVVLVSVSVRTAVVV